MGSTSTHDDRHDSIQLHCGYCSWKATRVSPQCNTRRIHASTYGDLWSSLVVWRRVQWEVGALCLEQTWNWPWQDKLSNSWLYAVLSEIAVNCLLGSLWDQLEWQLQAHTGRHEHIHCPRSTRQLCRWGSAPSTLQSNMHQVLVFGLSKPCPALTQWLGQYLVSTCGQHYNVLLRSNGFPVRSWKNTWYLSGVLNCKLVIGIVLIRMWLSLQNSAFNTLQVDCPWKLTPERQPHGWQVDHFCWEHVDAKRLMFCCCFCLVVGLWSISEGHRESLPIGGARLCPLSSVKDDLIQQHPLLVEIYHSVTANVSCVCSGDISPYFKYLSVVWKSLGY